MAFIAFFIVSLGLHTNRSNGETELGGIALGSTNATEILRNNGCYRAAATSIDDEGSLLLGGNFDMKTLEIAFEDHWRTAMGFAPKGSWSVPSFFREVFLCGDRQVYMLSTDFSPPRRVAGITLLFCSVDEEEGANVIYEKIGTKTYPSSLGGDAPIFYPRKFAGDKLQDTLSMNPPRIDKSVHAKVYKKPDGCILNFKPVAFLYGMMVMSEPLVMEAIKRDSARERRMIENIKPPGRL